MRKKGNLKQPLPDKRNGSRALKWDGLANFIVYKEEKNEKGSRKASNKAPSSQFHDLIEQHQKRREKQKKGAPKQKRNHLLIYPHSHIKIAEPEASRKITQQANQK